jgi:hypothetical protein
MKTVNRDALVAVLLLLFCGVMFWESYNIKTFESAAMDADVWPRLIVGTLTVLCAIYLIQSLRKPVQVEVVGIRALIGTYSNALWCFGLFALFLLTLDWLGILIGGFLFVFFCLTVLGNRSPRDHLSHAVTALITAALTWVVFSYALEVFLPQGTVFRIY